MNFLKIFFSRFFLKKNLTETNTTQTEQDEIKKIVYKTVQDVFQKQSENETNKRTETVDIPENFDRKLLEKLNHFNKLFFDSFRIPRSKYKIKIDKKNIFIEIDSKYFENELSKSDKLSVSYEHVFHRVIQNEIKDFDYRLFLRAGHSAKKHHDYTVAFATKIAHKVKQTGRRVVIPSKSNYERSIIHHVVEKIDGVQSKSTGTNANRNLIIYPEKNATHQPL